MGTEPRLDFDPVPRLTFLDGRRREEPLFRKLHERRGVMARKKARSLYDMASF